MANLFYERPGLSVDLYSERTEASAKGVLDGDTAFYIAQANEVGGPVLELACGNGRVLLPIASAGFEVAGIDLSEAMLAVAARRLGEQSEAVRSRVSLRYADMRTFDLERNFGLVIIPGRSFQMLLTPEDEQRCLDRVREHLRPGGRVAIDVFDPWLDALLPGAAGPPYAPRVEVGGHHPETGNEVRVEVLRRFNDTVNQVFEEQWRFTEVDDAGHTLRTDNETLKMRWIYRWEMHYLLERHGFRVLAEHSDYRGSPPAYGKEQVWVAERA
jgi:SAM-dependent methyltransferase